MCGLEEPFDLAKTSVTPTLSKTSDDGTVSGLDEQVKGLKESYKDLFGPAVSGTTPSNPDGKPAITTFDTLVNNADNMTAEEVAAQFEAMAKQ